MIEWFRDWLRRREQEQFNDAILACAESSMRKTEAALDKLPENLRPVYYARESAIRLFRLIERGAPEILIENERRLLLKHASALPCYWQDSAGAEPK